MTLILNFARPEFAIQVSDSRVTMPDGRIVNDDTVKSVVFSNQMVFGFTGMARMGQARTDMWLAKELVSLRNTASAHDACNHIQVCATEACRKLPWSWKLKKLAFVGVGYSCDPGTPSPIPTVVLISNFHDHEGRELAEPNSQFSIQRRVAEVGQTIGLAVPEWLTRRETDQLRRRVTHLNQRGVSAWPYVRTFRDYIRSVAGRTAAVGKSLMVTILPKPADPGLSVVMRGPCGFSIGIIPKTAEGKRLEEPSEIMSRPQPLFCDIPEGTDRRSIDAPLHAVPGTAAHMYFQVFPKALTEAEIKEMAKRHL